LLHFKINSVDEWRNIAESIKSRIIHNVLFLEGDLGSGKTTFTRYLLQTIGSTDNVSSPTYSIVNEYDTSMGKVFHFDLYRLKSRSELYDIDIEEYLENSYLSIIEWPEILEKEMPYISHHKMKIINSKNNLRLIEFI